MNILSTGTVLRYHLVAFGGLAKCFLTILMFFVVFEVY